jgi:hypothetical protein
MTEENPTAPQLGRSALVTSDIQVVTLSGHAFEVPGTSEVLPAVEKPASHYRRQRRPIVHVIRLYRPDGSNADLSRKTLARGSTPILRPGDPG